MPEEPSVLFYSQAMKLINELRESYSQGIGDVDEIARQIKDALTKFERGVGQPFLKYEPIVDTEPALSAKVNRLWTDLENDINILQYQVDLGRASATFTHNLLATEIQRSRQANSQVSNKLKTLQLYSDSVDSSITTFGDFFRSDEFLDLARVPPNDRAALLAEGHIILGRSGDMENLTATADISVLPDSNGFLGNLHEVTGEERTVTTWQQVAKVVNGQTVYVPEVITLKEPIFRAETAARLDINTILDGEPNTWIEYEYCKVSAADRLKAGNLNFTYTKPRVDTGDTNEDVTDEIDWASGPPDGVLKLALSIDLKNIQTINYISFMPFNLADNANYPVKIVEVQTSINGTDWQAVNPKNIYVTTTPNLQAARTAEDVVIGDAVWAFAMRSVRYIRMYIEQRQPMNRKLGHVYYVDETGKRVKGPTPSINNVMAGYASSGAVISYFAEDTTNGRPDDKTRSAYARREVFDGQRWAIGVRDISVQRLNFVTTSTIVTRPLRVNGIVDRVSLDAEVTIPSEYPNDRAWVAFHISPDDGLTWYQISRIRDDYLEIPEIISFNDPLPVALREDGVTYYSTDNPVTSLRLKVILTRPDDKGSTSPILHSYRLKVKKRI